MRVLTEKEIKEITEEMVSDGCPVRFFDDGQSVSIIAEGIKSPKGCNVINQIFYWNFTRETARKIAELTGTRPYFE